MENSHDYLSTNKVNFRICEVNYFTKVKATELVTRRSCNKDSRIKPSCSKIYQADMTSIARISGVLTLDSDNCLISFTLSAIYVQLKTFAPTMLNNIFTEHVALYIISPSKWFSSRSSILIERHFGNV